MIRRCFFEYSVAEAQPAFVVHDSLRRQEDKNVSKMELHFLKAYDGKILFFVLLNILS